MLYGLTATELVSKLEVTLEETVQKLKLVGDPVLKETRTFGVLGYPHFIVCIFNHLTDAEQFLAEELRGYPEQLTSNKFVFAAISCMVRPDTHDRLNPLLQPIMVTLRSWKRTGVRYINLRTSNRTIIGGKELSALIRDNIRTVRAGSVIVPSLEAIANYINPLLSHLFQPGSHLSLHPRLTRYLIEVVRSTSCDDVILRLRDIPTAEWDLPSTLRMRVKLYIGRADIRAYYVDSDLLRHLTGSILQTLLLTPNLFSRGGLRISEWYPVRDKNVLNLSFQLNEDDYAVIVLGDLSSFTNNDINAWVGCLALYAELRYSEEGFTPYHYCVRGELFSARTVDVLLVYLLLWIGATSTLPDGSTYRSIGGYLGIKANIILTIYGFVVRLIDLQRCLNNTQPRIRMSGQVGGDDFLIMLIGDDPDELMHYADELLTQVRSFVGVLKDPSIALIREGTAVLNAEFCKKPVVTILESTLLPLGGVSRHLSVRSMEKLPLMTELIKLDQLEGKRARNNAFRLFTVQIRHFFQEYSSGQELANAYYLAYLHTYHLDGFIQVVRWTTKSTNYELLESLEGLHMTKKVLRRVYLSENRFTETGELLTNNAKNRLRLLTASRAVDNVSAVVEGREERVYCMKNQDDAWIMRNYHRDLVHIEPSELAKELSDIFRRAREEIAPFLLLEGKEVDSSSESSPDTDS